MMNLHTNFPIFLFITMMLAIAGCNRSTGQELATGNQAFAESNYDQAIESYENALALDPAQGEPLYNFANTRYRQGIYTDTHTLLPQAAAIGSDELAIHSHYNAGNAHYQLKDWEAAVEAYKDSLRLNPADVDAKYNLELAMRNLTQQQNQQQENQEQQQDQEQDDQQQEQEQDNQEQDNQQQNNQEQQQDQEQDDQQQDQQQDNQQDGEQENQEEEEPSAEEQQQNAEESEEQQESEPAQAQQPAEVQPLTPEQARQLLRAVGQNTETLQEQMQMAAPADGSLPEKDW